MAAGGALPWALLFLAVAVEPWGSENLDCAQVARKTERRLGGISLSIGELSRLYPSSGSDVASPSYENPLIIAPRVLPDKHCRRLISSTAARMRSQLAPQLLDTVDQWPENQLQATLIPTIADP